MPKVNYGGQSYECGDLSVLDCLTAQGVPIPSSCHAGLCQTCMMQAVQGNVPARAQAGLKETLVAQNYFLACSCMPDEDIEIILPSSNLTRQSVTVAGIELLAADVLGIRLRPDQPLAYRAGQFINLFMDETTARCYSLASVPQIEDELFLHVRKVPGGLVSNWLFDSLQVGASMSISRALGDCFYVAGKPEQNILLIGTGTGLAPLYGIIRDALLHGHTGQISLYHGSYNTDGLYLIDKLREIAGAHANFSYLPCVSEDEAPQGYAKGMVLDVAMAEHPDLSGWRVFLCGNPNMVNAARRETFLAGASTREIFADPF